MEWLGWLKQRLDAVRRVYPALLATLVVVTLTTTLYGLGHLRVGTLTRTGKGVTATATGMASPSATLSQPPISGPPPTTAPGGHPVVPSNGTDPFIVQAVTMVPYCYNVGSNGSIGGQSNCTGQSLCPAPAVVIFIGYVSLPQNAPDDYYTYRWRLSDGTVTAPATAHYSWDNQYNQNTVSYAYTPSASNFMGGSISVQLEIIQPNALISAPSPTFTFTCGTMYNGIIVTPGFGFQSYDCAVGGTQSFPYSATMAMYPSPSFTVTYYWQRSDGSRSSTFTSTSVAGATRMALTGDTITLTAPNPPPPVGPSPIADYTDAVILVSAPPWDSQHQIGNDTGVTISMPNCSDPTAVPPTPTAPPPTPTATQLAPTPTP